MSMLIGTRKAKLLPNVSMNQLISMLETAVILCISRLSSSASAVRANTGLFWKSRIMLIAIQQLQIRWFITSNKGAFRAIGLLLNWVSLCDQHISHILQLEECLSRPNSLFIAIPTIIFVIALFQPIDMTLRVSLPCAEKGCILVSSKFDQKSQFGSRKKQSDS